MRTNSSPTLLLRGQRGRVLNHSCHLHCDIKNWQFSEINFPKVHGAETLMAMAPSQLEFLIRQINFFGTLFQYDNDTRLFFFWEHRWTHFTVAVAYN